MENNLTENNEVTEKQERDYLQIVENTLAQEVGKPLEELKGTPNFELGIKNLTDKYPADTWFDRKKRMMVLKDFINEVGVVACLVKL